MTMKGDGWIDALATPRGAAAFVLANAFLIFAIRITLFPALANDEAEILRQTQVWSLTPDIKNPPLYAWIHKCAETAFGGPSLAVALAVKHGLAAAAGLAYLALARRMFADESWAGAGAFALFGAHFWSVDSAAAYTHSILLVATGALALERALAFASRPNLAKAAWLGVALALGLLSKWNFAVLGSGVLAALGWEPNARRALAGPCGAVLLVALLAPTAPVLGALAQEWRTAEALVTEKFDVETAWKGWEGAASVLINMVVALSPALLVAALAAPRATWAGFKRLAMGRDDANGAARLAARAAVLALLVTVLAVLVTGAGRTRTHLTLVFAPLTLVMLASARAGGQGSRIARAMIVVGTVTGLAGPAFIIGKAWIDGRGEGNAYANVRYAPVAEAIAAFEARAVHTWEHPFSIAGNLRALDASPAYYAVERQELASPARQGPCVFVWRANHLDDDITPLRVFVERFGAPPDFAHGVIVQAPYAFGAGRSVRFAVAPTTAPPGCENDRATPPVSSQVRPDR